MVHGKRNGTEGMNMYIGGVEREQVSKYQAVIFCYILTWPQLYKRWIVLSTGQISIQWIKQLVSLILIRWIVIYPVDNAI